MTSATTHDGRDSGVSGPGRPRDETIDEQIIAVTLALMTLRKT